MAGWYHDRSINQERHHTVEKDQSITEDVTMW